ncbi:MULTISPECIES: NAD(P)/FAD-dependent oxidoreductase [unclassified Bradyrhizobium]|uniref:NAD(P)/FAD-dependent oxidoreductase n=1 Tax=unclassified Bradyrhizobium TaxID=2631580 RepID=UPI0029166739|nr:MULTISPECIES: FAD-dependent oxidoreductase [unclassified Bradyrhizobium]
MGQGAVTKGPVVIVGAGHAGFQLATSLRQAGFADPIHLINDESHLPYQRPPLSKAYLKGTGGPETLMFRPQKFYADQTIDLVYDRAVAVQRDQRRVLLASGRTLDYGHLVFATGARNRLLDIPNANLPAVRYLRILDDSEALRGLLADAKRAVVIGAGFIGLEFAATARIKGLEVDVLELGARVMARAVTAEISDYFQKQHAEAGVRIHLGVQATSIKADGNNVTGVSLSDGRHIPADLVVVGVGVLPNVELAAEAGLQVASGIVVDEYLLTSDPHISAIGDCALFVSQRFGGTLRLESVQNATDHARCVAARLTGDVKPYDGQPWFWSDQGNDKLQIAGLTTGYDQVVLRGDPAQKAFSAFCYKEGRLVGIESVNRAGDHMFGRKLLAAGGTLDAAKAADPSFDLKSALA